MLDAVSKGPALLRDVAKGQGPCAQIGWEISALMEQELTHSGNSGHLVTNRL